MWFQIPTQFDSIFTLLGMGAGGLAIFTTGIVLKTRQITFNKTICSTILLKNLAFPLVIWGCMALFNSPTTPDPVGGRSLGHPHGHDALHAGNSL